MTVQRNYRLRLKKLIGWTTYFGVCFHELNPATGVLRIQQTDGTMHILYGHKLDITLLPEFMEQEIQAKLEEEQAKRRVKEGSVIVTDNIASALPVEDELDPEEVAVQVRIAEEGLERWRMAQRNMQPLADSNVALSPETTSTFAN